MCGRLWFRAKSGILSVRVIHDRSNMIEHKKWPKTPRLNRDMIVTEKIDGTNAAVIVLSAAEVDPSLEAGDVTDCGSGICVSVDSGNFVVAAQSRNRVLQIGKTADNAGFGAWVRENAEGLAEVLGSGYIYGEWWGSKVGRTYGRIDGDRNFSLFNVERYAHVDSVVDPVIPGLGLVPILYEGRFSQAKIDSLVEDLRENGSRLRSGHKAEGVVVYHKAGGHVYKVLCEGDELPKGVAELKPNGRV